MTAPLSSRGAQRRGIRFSLALSFLLVSACFHGKLPAREFYRLHLPEPTDSIAAATIDHEGSSSALPAGSVAILPYVAPGLYGDGNIVYRIEDASYGSCLHNAWGGPTPTPLG